MTNRRRVRVHRLGPVPAPTNQDVAAVAEEVYRKVARILDARGDDDGAALASTEPAFARLAGPSVPGVAATRAGGRLRPARTDGAGV